MVIVMALFNVPQYTRMVSLTRDYIYMMTEPVFISIHYFELMFINYWFIAHFELAMPKIAKNGLYITKNNVAAPQTSPSLLKSLVSYPDPNVRNDDYRLQYNITYAVL